MTPSYEHDEHPSCRSGNWAPMCQPLDPPTPEGGAPPRNKRDITRLLLTMPTYAVGAIFKKHGVVFDHSAKHVDGFVKAIEDARQAGVWDAIAAEIDRENPQPQPSGNGPATAPEPKADAPPTPGRMWSVRPAASRKYSILCDADGTPVIDLPTEIAERIVEATTVRELPPLNDTRLEPAELEALYALRDGCRESFFECLAMALEAAYDLHTNAAELRKIAALRRAAEPPVPSTDGR